MKKTAPPIAALICGYDTPIIAFANQFTKAVNATALGLVIEKFIDFLRSKIYGPFNGLE